jgi:hypothetical protein
MHSSDVWQALLALAAVNSMPVSCNNSQTGSSRGSGTRSSRLWVHQQQLSVQDDQHLHPQALQLLLVLPSSSNSRGSSSGSLKLLSSKR